jgi:hypothetical protein
MGEPEREARAGSVRARRLDASTHRARELVDDRQSEAGTDGALAAMTVRFRLQVSGFTRS